MHKSTLLYVTVSCGYILSRILIASLRLKCCIAELLLRVREGGREAGREARRGLYSKSTFHIFSHKMRG